jgi:hypothetical protein
LFLFYFQNIKFAICLSCFDCHVGMHRKAPGNRVGRPRKERVVKQGMIWNDPQEAGSCIGTGRRRVAPFSLQRLPLRKASRVGIKQIRWDRSG